MAMKNTPLLTRIRHFMGFRDTSKGRRERVAAAADQQNAKEIDDAQGRALKRLRNELDMVQTAIQTQAQPQYQQRIKRKEVTPNDRQS